MRAGEAKAAGVVKFYNRRDKYVTPAWRDVWTNRNFPLAHAWTLAPRSSMVVGTNFPVKAHARPFVPSSPHPTACG